MPRQKLTNIKILTKNFEQIRTSPKAMALLNDIADATARRAGDGFEAKPAAITGGRVRGRAAVVTTDYEAMVKQAKDHALERALGGRNG